MRSCVISITLLILVALPCFGNEGDGVELVGETVEFEMGSKFSSATFGERPDQIGDVSGELRLSMYGAEVEPNPAGAGNQANEIRIYFKFDGALAGRAGYQLCAWVIGEDLRGESKDFSCDWPTKLAQLLAADSDVSGQGLFPITIIEGMDPLEFNDTAEDKQKFVTWCAQNLHESIMADERLKSWATDHDTSILTQYKTGFRLVREGDVYIVHKDNGEPEEPDTDYSLVPRRLYHSAGSRTARTSDYCQRRGHARLNNSNYNFGSLRKRDENNELATYYVVGLARPSIEGAELVFKLYVIKWPLEGRQMYHEIRGQEAVNALKSLRCIRVVDGAYAFDTCNWVKYTSGAGANWQSNDSYQMVNRERLAHINEHYPLSQ